MDTNETILNENKFTLTPEEMELSKNPESFKIYLDYKAKIQETMFAEVGKQRDKEFESLNLQREREFELTKQQHEREFELTKLQREREFETMKWQQEQNAEALRIMDQRRKDAWSTILGVGAAIVENFCENNSNPSSIPIGTPLNPDDMDPEIPIR